MLRNPVVKAASNGSVAPAIMAPIELREIAGGELPFDEIEEVTLALKTCQELDNDALEDLARIQSLGGARGEIFAAVEQLAYSAAIRRWYVTRFRAMRSRIQLEPPPTR